MSLGVVALMSVEELKKTLAPADYYEWVGTVLTSDGSLLGATIVNERRNTFPQGVAFLDGGAVRATCRLSVPDATDANGVFCTLTMRDSASPASGSAVYYCSAGVVEIRTAAITTSTSDRVSRLVDCVIRYYHGGQ